MAFFSDLPTTFALRRKPSPRPPRAPYLLPRPRKIQAVCTNIIGAVKYRARASNDRRATRLDSRLRCDRDVSRAQSSARLRSAWAASCGSSVIGEAMPRIRADQGPTPHSTPVPHGMSWNVAPRAGRKAGSADVAAAGTAPEQQIRPPGAAW